LSLFIILYDMSSTFNNVVLLIVSIYYIARYVLHVHLFK
jgi:hypothetical protein